MAVAKVSELFVDLDQGVEEGEREAEKRFVAVEHDEESGSKRYWREVARPGLEKCLVELA